MNGDDEEAPSRKKRPFLSLRAPEISAIIPGALLGTRYLVIVQAKRDPPPVHFRRVLSSPMAFEYVDLHGGFFVIAHPDNANIYLYVYREPFQGGSFGIRDDECGSTPGTLNNVVIPSFEDG